MRCSSSSSQSRRRVPVLRATSVGARLADPRRHCAPPCVDGSVSDAQSDHARRRPARRSDEGFVADQESGTSRPEGPARTRRAEGAKVTTSAGQGHPSDPWAARTVDRHVPPIGPTLRRGPRQARAVVGSGFGADAGRDRLRHARRLANRITATLYWYQFMQSVAVRGASPAGLTHAGCTSPSRDRFDHVVESFTQLGFRPRAHCEPDDRQHPRSRNRRRSKRRRAWRCRGRRPAATPCASPTASPPPV